MLDRLGRHLHAAVRTVVLTADYTADVLRWSFLAPDYGLDNEKLLGHR